MLGGALENLRIVREYFAESLFAVAMRTVALAARSGEARGGAARRAKYDHPLAISNSVLLSKSVPFWFFW